MRYYFDLRDGDRLIRDDIGANCPTLDAARVEAVVVLTSMAREWLPSDGAKRDLTIIARDGTGQLFEASFRFEVRSLSSEANKSTHVLPSGISQH